MRKVTHKKWRLDVLHAIKRKCNPKNCLYRIPCNEGLYDCPLLPYKDGHDPAPRPQRIMNAEQRAKSMENINYMIACRAKYKKQREQQEKIEKNK